jgi:hypothetical protein
MKDTKGKATCDVLDRSTKLSGTNVTVKVRVLLVNLSHFLGKKKNILSSPPLDDSEV